jgi:hypothetical protein
MRFSSGLSSLPKAVGFGQRLNGLVSTVAEVLHPGMSANDGLDQTLVACWILRTFVLHHGCSSRCLASPRNSDLLRGAILVRDASNLDQQLASSDNDAVYLSDVEGCIIETLLLMCCSLAIASACRSM